MKGRRFRLLVVALLLVGASTFSASAATAADRDVIVVACTASSFTVDAHAFHGQKTEVTAFYRATGIVCRLLDESGNVLFDPSAP
jgi:hypothetical protein